MIRGVLSPGRRAPATADRDLTRSAGLLVTWLPAWRVRSACRRERGSTVSDPDTTAITRYAVFCGLDVGKTEHHACALDPAGKRLHDKALPNDETALRAVFDRRSPHAAGCWSWSTSPPRSARWPIAVARDVGIEVAYLPGLAMRRHRRPAPRRGQDRRPRRLHHRRRRPHHAPHPAPGRRRRRTLAELAVLAGFDDDLAAAVDPADQPAARPAAQIHPALERAARARIWTAAPCSTCWPLRRPRPGCGELGAERHRRGSCAPRPRGWPPTLPTRSSPRWPRRPSSFPAPPRRAGHLPELAAPAARRPRPTRRPSPPARGSAWMPTLLPRS